MNRLLPAATMTVLFGALALASPAKAFDLSDEKMYHGSDCQVFGSTPWTDLSFSGYGVKNLASSARNIICPIVKDSESLYGGGELYVTVATGGVSASWTCTVYITSTVSDTLSNSYAISSGGVQPPNTPIYATHPGTFSSVAGSDGLRDKAYMLCTLGPQVRLRGYFVSENTPTSP